ncbi:hypothetical protein CSQ85_00370 [Bifidobacterium rousetti]|uniref:hypothetical protein n=1 Tax=Bifidobacterium rousetti TaxID=2045439 RepID=UPI00123B12CB|nr:hypothetical protein [Bifidobacterium rousetti]KAA8820305.1 hypothetical protein CSQ85_00370 [Bifidobacterium rousetti]
MDWWNLFWTGFGAVVGMFGAVAGFVALFQTRKANKLAKDANLIAQEANRIAGESRDAASRANDLARQANEIGEHANLIAQRALSAGRDQTVYRWASEFDAERAVLRLIDDCGLDARDVHVVVRFEGQTVGEGGADRMPAYGQVTLEVPLLVEKLHEEAVSLRRSGVIGSPHVKVTIGVVWVSELGVYRSLECEQGFGYAKRKKILA